jgi:hypothetical protein
MATVQFTITRFEPDGLGNTWVEGEFAGGTFRPFRLPAVGGFDALKGQALSCILDQVAEALGQYAV